MAPAIEHRQHPRLQAELSLFYRCPAADSGELRTFKATTRDISPRGLSFWAEPAGQCLALNQLLDVVVKIPSRDYTLVRLHVIQAQARIVRLAWHPGHHQFFVALEFLGRPEVWSPPRPPASPDAVHPPQPGAPLASAVR